MSWPAFHQGIGKQTAFLCLAAIAVIGFTVGGLTTGWRQDAQRETQGQSTGLGINVDTQDLRRVVLQSHRGLATNWGSFSDSPRVVFFGYTFCPDICPTGLSNVAGAVNILDKQGLKLNPIFVTIDPRRDTPAVLKTYVSAFHDRLEGLTGKADRIKTLASAFLVFYEINSKTKEDEYYLMDHTSYVYLVNDDGEMLGYYSESKSPTELAEAMLTDYQNYNSN